MGQITQAVFNFRIAFRLISSTVFQYLCLKFLGFKLLNLCTDRDRIVSSAGGYQFLIESRGGKKKVGPPIGHVCRQQTVVKVI